jgi:hypothetical protein
MKGFIMITSVEYRENSVLINGDIEINISSLTKDSIDVSFTRELLTDEEVKEIVQEFFLTMMKKEEEK